MKYLVNRQTKEHFVYHGIVPSENWDVVEADADGWIKWNGDTEWPLPDNCSVELVSSTGFKHSGAACGFCWNAVRRYRPILDKSEVVMTPKASGSVDVVTPEVGSLLVRLKAAHEAAQRIPEIEVELREVLGAMGYDLVARSPFADLTQQEPAEDMSDWRNWKPGDLVKRVRDPVEQCAKLGGVYRLTRVDTTEAGTERAWYIGEDGAEVWSSPNNFRFHSSPEVRS